MRRLLNLFLLLLSVSSFAQDYDFSPLYYRLRTPKWNYTESDYDVVIKTPTGYELVIDSVGDYRGFVVEEPTGNANGVACMHPMIYKSLDGNALLLFPLLDIDNQQMGRYLKYEARWVSEGPYSEISGTYKELTGDEAQRICNAHKGEIYEVKLRKPFVKAYKSGVDKYDYCIGVYFEKELHPVLRMKILLTEEGYKEKEKHINALLSCFQYGDSASDAAKSGMMYSDAVFNALRKVWHEGGNEALYFIMGGDSERVVKNYKTKVMMHKFMTGSDLAPVDSVLQLYWDEGGKQAQKHINKVIGK